MPYVIQFEDLPDTMQRKIEIRPTHIEWVTKNAYRIILSGGFFPEGNDFPNGGLIVLDVETRQDAIDYIENDPFFIAGIFKNYSVKKFKKFIFDHKRV